MTEGGEECLTDAAVAVTVGRARAEQPYFVKDVDAVEACIAVEAGIDTVDEQSFAGNGGIEELGFVAVFNDVELVGVGTGEAVDVGAWHGVGDGVECVGAGGGDEGYAVDPVAVFVFHVGAHVLWGLGVGGHEVPLAYGRDTRGFVVAVEVGGAE